jgi:hypothetical protein
MNRLARDEKYFNSRNNMFIINFHLIAYKQMINIANSVQLSGIADS